MNKFNHLDMLLRQIVKTADTKTDEEQRKTVMNDFDTVSHCIDSYVDYHNEAVRQGQAIQTSRILMSEEKFMNYIHNLHEHRKKMHQNMIDSTIMLNCICEKYELGPVYDGPLDAAKGRDDDDTRFSVAEFAEELCHDFYKTSDIIAVPEKARRVYHNYEQDIKTKSSSWDMMQSMLNRAKAQSGMDSHDNPEF